MAEVMEQEGKGYRIDGGVAIICGDIRQSIQMIGKCFIGSPHRNPGLCVERYLMIRLLATKETILCWNYRSVPEVNIKTIFR